MQEPRFVITIAVSAFTELGIGTVYTKAKPLSWWEFSKIENPSGEKATFLPLWS